MGSRYQRCRVKEWADLRKGPLQRLRSGFTQPLPPELATELASLTERIDHLALLLAQLPERPLTQTQRNLLRSIARELLRRAG
jgi:hypothetical protein